MPNHITNIVSFKGDKKQIELLIKHVQSEKEDTDIMGKPNGEKYITHFDFNKIIPMPEELNITSGTETDKGIALIDANSEEAKAMLGYNWKDDNGNIINTYAQLKEYLLKGFKGKDGKQRLADCMKLGQQAIDNIKKYGYKDWYDWAYDNWGTKWNAYDTHIEEDGVITFDTAWACPERVFKKLSTMFPKVEITVKFADEDIGSNCGILTCKNGRVSFEDRAGDDAFAYEVKGWSPEEDEDEDEE